MRSILNGFLFVRSLQAQPAWQKAAVAQYFVTGKGKIPPASSGYNISGRAYPDIAAQASRTITHRRLVNARALLVVPPRRPRNGGCGATNISVAFGVGSKLHLPLYADVRTPI